MPVSGNASDAFGVATMTWQASASSTPPPSARPWRRATTGFGQALERAQQILRPLGELRDGADSARFDVPHEEPDVGSRHERLAAPRDDDALHQGIRGRRAEGLVQLRDDLFVERVHRVGAIDRQRRDASGDVRSDQREAERRCLFEPERRAWPASAGSTARRNRRRAPGCARSRSDSSARRGRAASASRRARRCRCPRSCRRPRRRAPRRRSTTPSPVDRRRP